MVQQKITFLLVTLFMVTTVSISNATQSKGRKLFGGYRIAPKNCQPTNPGRIKSDLPAVCMFNYECSRRNGEVVGACMDGFLFGACCQLPDKKLTESLEKLPMTDDPFVNIHEIDHVPDIPILLNPDGSPIGSLGVSDSTTKSQFSPTTSYTKDSYENAEKPQLPDLNKLEDNFSSLLNPEQSLNDLKLPSLITHTDSNNDIQEQQLQQQPITLEVTPVTTLLNPDQILQVADPVDQLPALFSQGIHKNNDSGAETILFNVNGTEINDSNNPDEIFKPTFNTENTMFSSPSTKSRLQYSTQTPSTRQSTNQKLETTDSNFSERTTTKVSSSSYNTNYLEKSSSTMQMNNVSEEKANTITKKVTVPMTAETKTYSKFTSVTPPTSMTTQTKDDLVRVPTITYNGQSGNKKHDEIDKEEIAINHIISILNETNDAKITTNKVTENPTTYKYTGTDSSSRPTLVKIITTHSSLGITESLPQTIYSAVSSPGYYHYNTQPSGQLNSHYTSSNLANSISTQSAAYQNSNDNRYTYSSRPTTNPPAPTVIVLGPLGTEYTTASTQSTVNRINTKTTQKISGINTKPQIESITPSFVTKKPSVATTLTHNINTVISGNKQVLSVSYVSVDLKDGTTSKPSTIKDTVEMEVSQNDYDIKPITKRPSTIYTTLTSWSEKPNFHLKPSTPSFNWPEDDNNGDITHKITRPGLTTVGSNCEEDTAVSDDFNNFPPVRHPELDSTMTHLQDRPTLVEPGDIISEDEIPTPDFVEDADLNSKVDVFVNKIVESLQGNFQNLKDVVYNPKNVTTVNLANNATRPAISATTKKPFIKSTVKTTKRPSSVRISTTQKASTIKPKPVTIGTKKPSTTKRPKPPKKNTTSTTTTESVPFVVETTTKAKPVEATTTIPQIKPNADFRSICGIRPLIKTGRIVGGKGSTFGEWPWQVLVREATWLGLFVKNKCGGVLITNKYVITAAHCQPGFLASLVAVFGEFDISGELESKRSVTRNVRRVIVNRGYDLATFENDIALLELETPIQFDAHIIPICMPDNNTDYVNRMATVTGWGRLKYNGGVPSVLQEVKVPIIKNSVCQEMFQTAGHSKLILDSFICAGYANGQKDSCEGDSGGPLTLQREDGRWILVGTVSHGIKCASPYLPGVYMRTTYFKPWLHSITGV